MSLQDSYNLLETMSKRFKVGDNAQTKTVQDNNQRTASIVNNSTSEQNDSLCADMISEVVKVAAERVKSKQQQRTASITSKFDEVALLQKFLNRAYQYHFLFFQFSCFYYCLTFSQVCHNAFVLMDQALYD